MRYKQCRYKGRRMRLHIAVWIEAFGEIPEGYCIHHINHNKLDNAIENLMLMTKSEHHKLHAYGRSRKKGRFV